MLDSVAKHLQPETLRMRYGMAGPGGVLNCIDIPFGVRHESKDQPCRVADAGNVIHAAVGIIRCIRERYLAIFPKCRSDVRVSRDKFAFTMGDR